MVSNTYCVGFLGFFSSCVAVSLDCPFLIAPSVFYNVYSVSSTNKTDRHAMSELFLKVALKTKTLTLFV
jgi:hypothetical protein